MSGKKLAYELILSPRAIKQLKQMEKQDRERIKESLSGLRVIPPFGDIKKLKGLKGRFRLRVGNWRVILFYNTKEKKVFISEILPRREAY